MAFRPGERGFLPSPDPNRALPDEFSAWDDIGHDLPKLLAAGRARAVLEHLPARDTDRLSEADVPRAMLLLSFFGHAYVWESWRESPAERVPAAVARPWFSVAQRLGRPPVLSYASYALDTIAQALAKMHDTLRRMPEGCDPYIYYNRVRPFIHGWHQNPVVYEGVSEYRGAPQGHYGETGAQSTIVPCLDAVLGVGHQPDELRVYLAGMRAYMPRAHVEFLEQLESHPPVRDFVMQSADAQLREIYDACVAELAAFRSTHLEYAARYIQNQTEVGANTNVYGTGGTPFMRYLKKHRDETAQHQLVAGGAGR